MRAALDIQFAIGETAVRSGDLIIPASSIEPTLYRYAKTLVCLNDDVDFPYSIRGTMTSLRFRDRYFSVFCKHQISGFSPANVGQFPRAEGGRFYICGGIYRDVCIDESNSGEEFIDACAIEYDLAKYSMTNLHSEFFNVIENDCWPSNTTGHLILFGSPSKIQNFKIFQSDVEAKLEEIKFATVVVAGSHVGRSHARWIQSAEMRRKANFDTDGMSGGPVFHLGRDRRGYFVGLAGMIMRASPSSNRFHFIDTSFLKQFGESD
ncbi:MAG: hypothetical protein P4M15_00970 [Alphaproteobacteria bacterium]|nr:hypothetical protein [Alphaproteobacteria bacterium]